VISIAAVEELHAVQSQTRRIIMLNPIMDVHWCYATQDGAVPQMLGNHETSFRRLPLVDK